ncbi:S1 family peptidase [Actinokineospora diospyrosa]|uniref:Trypsin-like peptidase domain-containing protein n=1 Tax=Actinokineospora diospyrosa TaxID=103728 RepID=A0ABT1IIP5_9PSEU|nr:serine protease [Actinokineospora diospyrosa]MCP2272532.1 Trypsin-like peptidase domain-containing protein [Actinokineospora diospyrosa]
MIKRVVGVLATALAAAAVVVSPASAAAYADFTGIVALDNCSGSVVRPPAAVDSDPALVLTNGHCVKLMGANEVIVNQASSRTFTLLGGSGQSLGTLRATKLAYATMKNTDAAFYQLSSTYAQIQQQYRSRALDLSASKPAQGTGIQVVSGYWKRIYTCAVDGFAYQLKEGSWTWKDSIRYTRPCNVIGGTSGSPIIDTAGKVVGVNNTINESGGRCTMNNPCEVSQTGQITVRSGIGYAQETYDIVACIGAGNQFVLTRPGCTLPR